MARPCKSAKLLTDKSQTKEELSVRKERENILRGKSSKPPSPPQELSDSQKKIFRFIVNELKSADILCRLDMWILQECAVAIDCLNRINSDMKSKPELIYSKDVLSAKEKYSKIFFRCCNELSLSPQSRAKIANINAQTDDGTELLRKILAGDVDLEEKE